MIIVFKSKLKELVENKYGNLTQAEISRRTGVRRRTVANWLDEDFIFTKLDLVVARPFAAFLGCKVLDLVEEAEIEEEEPDRLAV